MDRAFEIVLYVYDTDNNRYLSFAFSCSIDVISRDKGIVISGIFI